jgi:hypothetical protein
VTWLRLLVAVLQIAPACKPEEVLAMDAMLALALCGERARQVERGRGGAGDRGGAEGDGQWVHHPDGTATVQIRSLDSLRGLLRGGK